MTAEPPPSPPSSPGPARRPHVVVADDDREMRAVMVRALVQDGYRVSEAVDGFDVLRAVRGTEAHPGPPDLIVSDVRMRGMSGLELVSYLRSCGYAAPIILVTAFCEADTRDEARARGATALLSKPFDLDELRAAATALVPLPRRPGLGPG